MASRIWLSFVLLLLGAFPVTHPVAAAPADVSQIRSQLVYYGDWSAADIPNLQRFDLVVLQENRFQGGDENAAI
jgi:hypothetical protein